MHVIFGNDLRNIQIQERNRACKSDDWANFRGNHSCAVLLWRISIRQTWQSKASTMKHFFLRSNCVPFRPGFVLGCGPCAVLMPIKKREERKALSSSACHFAIPTNMLTKGRGLFKGSLRLREEVEISQISSFPCKVENFSSFFWKQITHGAFSRTKD